MTKLNVIEAMTLGADCLELDERDTAEHELREAIRKVHELVEAAAEVHRISDRHHDAWDRLESAIEAVKGHA